MRDFFNGACSLGMDGIGYSITRVYESFTSGFELHTLVDNTRTSDISKLAIHPRSFLAAHLSWQLCSSPRRSHESD